MTIAEFDIFGFTANQVAVFKGNKYPIANIDFEERLIGILEDISGGEPDDVSWKRCESITEVLPA